jgi:hypothetical protein
MSELESIKEILATAAEANSKAIELQTNFYSSFTRRQGEALAALADLRVNSLKEMASCDGFESAIEQNSEFNTQAGQLIEELYSENVGLLKDLSTELKGIYEPGKS